MAMDWTNERWVKLYTRKTAEDLGLTWQARMLWPAILADCNRAGVIAVKPGPRRFKLLAALLHAPIGFVKAAVAELLEDGRLIETETGFVAPRFLEAQEAKTSDAERQRRHRERARDVALLGAVTKRDEMSRGVTPAVTPRRRLVVEVSSGRRVEENSPAQKKLPLLTSIPSVVGECWEMMQVSRKEKGLHREPLPRKFSAWHSEWIEPLKSEGLERCSWAYGLFLEDEAFAENGWAANVFMHPPVCGPRLSARRSKRRTANEVLGL